MSAETKNQKFDQTLKDEQLDEVAGGVQSDYQEIYRLLKKNGAVSGNVRNMPEINTASEIEKVEDVLSNIFDGNVEIMRNDNKEDVYWLNGKMMTKNEVVAGIKKYYNQQGAK